MGILETGLKAVVAVKAADVIHQRIMDRQDARWAAQGHPPGGPPPGGHMPAGGHVPAGQPPVAPAPAPVPATTSQPGATVDDVLDQLARLGGLRDSGVLTDAEFETQKARILNG